jgi:cytochrome c1
MVPNEADAAAIARGEAAAVRLGCGACHVLPGIEWPRGRVGPDLAGFGRRATIAGSVPNRPATLARFVRDAPRFVPEGAMPAVPMSDREARDLAAWLQSLRD